MLTPEQTLQTLADLDPDFPAFAASLPPELARADHILPEDLAADVVALLRAESPELAGWMDALPNAPQHKMAAGTLATIGTLAAILFVLRSRFKVDIRFRGVHILIDYKPIRSEQLLKILHDLSSFWGGLL